VLWLLAAALASRGAAELEVETNTDSVLNRTNANWALYEHSQELFGEDEVVVVALESEVPFDPALLAEVDRLTDAFQGIRGVRRVDSLATVPIIRVSGDGTLELDPALGDGPPETPVAAAAMAALVRGDRIAPGSLVSRDERVFAINVLLEADTEALYPQILARVREAIGERRAWVSGVPVFRIAADERTRREILIFVPLTVCVIGALLFALFRSAAAVVIPLAASGLGTWALVSAMGALGVPLTITTAILPSVLLALGCAYVMHLLTAGAGAGDREALARALEPVARPIGLSGVTTAIGFLAIASVPIDAIRYVGGFGAVGVLAVVLAGLTAAPAALALWPVPRRSTRIEAALRGPARRRVVESALGRPRVLVGAWLAVLAVAGVGALRLQVDTDVTRWFPEGSEVRDAWDSIRERLSGLTPINVLIESQDGTPVTEAAPLRAIDALSAYLGALPVVGKAVSVADPLRQIHGGFLDDPSRPLPDAFDLTEQYLLLLSSVDSMRDLVSDGREAANILLRVDNNGSKPIRELADDVDAWWRENGVAGFSARTTGTMQVFAQSEDDIAYGQLQGLFYALGGIGGILLLSFRSPLLVGTALLANFTPVALLFGLMGLAGVPLDAGTVLVGSIALGIAVDDTLHVITGFHAERRRGATRRQALESAYGLVLPPLVYTTLAISLGFLVLGVSPFQFTRNLGLLTAAVMAICLVSNVTLLPALLARLRAPAR